MDAIVPAAGEGSRLRPLTADRPKPLVEVAGKPLLARVFDALAPAGPDRFVVVIGYEGAAIRERFGARYRGVPIEYVRQERRLGLAHAVGRAGAVVDGDCLVCNGDNVFASSLVPLWEAHRSAASTGGGVSAEVVEPADSGERSDKRASKQRASDDRATADSGAYVGTMLVETATPDRARRVGAVVTDDQGTVERVVEKADDPPSTLVSAGAFAFGPQLFEACAAIEPAATGEYELADAITWLVERGDRVGTCRFEGKRVNVNEPADVDRAAAILDGE